MTRSTSLIVTEQRIINRSDPAQKARTLSVEEAAGLLGISRSTAYECVKSGELPSLRFRRRIVIPRDVVERILNSARAA